MSHSEAQLSRVAAVLDNLDLAHDPMTVVEFDGYVAGLVVCPERVPPSQWLGEVWGDPEFDDIGDAEATLRDLMGHYNRVACALADDPEAYAPVYEIDERSGEVFWEAWIRGFERAVRLRIESWESILRSDDEDAAVAVNLILAMSALVDGTSTLSEEAAEKITREAPFLIPCCVLDLNAWTRERRGLGTAELAGVGPDPWPTPGTRAVDSRKVGCNEPCPCGSGRTHARCCGAH